MQAGGTRVGRAVHWEDTDYRFIMQEAPACEWVMPELGNDELVHSAFNSASLLVTGSLPPFADIRTLPVAQYPLIAPPSIVVTATYPGATAAVISGSFWKRLR